MTTPNDKIRDVLKVWGQWREFYDQPLPADDQLRQLAQLALITTQPARSDDQQDEQEPRDKAWLNSSPWDWNPSQCKGCGVMPGASHADDCAYRQPARCSAHGDQQCTWCAQTVPGGLNDDGTCQGCDVYAEAGMHWDTCPYRVRGVPPARVMTCHAKHPEDDRVTCQVHHHPASRHPWRHSNFDQAISWLEENPPDHGEQEAPEAPATVAITQEAVTGLVDLLHQAAVKFTRLNTAYKGSATKGANTLAAECEQASQLLQSVIDGKEAVADA